MQQLTEPSTSCPEPAAQAGASPKTADKLPVHWARVLHIVNGEHYSGAERVQDLLALELEKFGFEVHFACLKPRLFPRQRQSQVPLEKTPMYGRIDLRPAFYLAKYAVRHDIHLVHAHTPRALLIGWIVSRLTGLPLIYHVHSPAYRDSEHQLRNWLNWQLERALMPGVAKAICVSAGLAKELSHRGIPPSKLAVIPNGVPRQQARKWQPPEKCLWQIGTVALFRPRKGLETLLQATAKLVQERLPVRVIAVGGFETQQYRQVILDLVERLGIGPNVTFTGFTDKVLDWLRQFDLFVLPSLFGEGLPMVLLEAMAVGLPIVATQIPGITDAVRDGQEAILVPPGSADALAEAIRAIIAGKTNASFLAQAALARQRSMFSAESMAAQTAAVYSKVLEQHALRRR